MLWVRRGSWRHPSVSSSIEVISAIRQRRPQRRLVAGLAHGRIEADHTTDPGVGLLGRVGGEDTEDDRDVGLERDAHDARSRFARDSPSSSCQRPTMNHCRCSRVKTPLTVI